MLTRETRIQYRTMLDAAFIQESGEAPALIFVSSDSPPQTLSRRSFHSQVSIYAAAMQSAGIRPRDLVVIADTQSLDSVIAFWGALMAGAIPSMFPTLTEKLDPAIYMRNMAELVTLSEVRAIFTSDEFAPRLREKVTCPVYSMNHLLDTMEQTDKTFFPFPPAPSDIAFLQHSSGTTGLQKGVALTHEALLNQLASYSEAIALHESDVIVSWLPLYHDMGLIAGFLLPLIQGIPLILMSPFDWVAHPALLLKTIDEYQGTLCWLPNFAYNHMARRIRQRDTEGLSLESMRAFINCSEPVRDDSHRLFVERFRSIGMDESRLAVSYAMAENTFAVTQTPTGQPPRVDIVRRHALDSDLRAIPVSVKPDADERETLEIVSTQAVLSMVSCGTPIEGVEVHVLDAEGQILPERHVGEIAIRSDSMLKGYYKRDDLHPLNSEGWYATGDRGYLAEGDVFVIGRSKDLIIHAGKNIYPQDIEAIINTVSGIHPGRAVVFGVPDDKEGTELIAVVAEVDAAAAENPQPIQQAIRLAVASQTDVAIHFVTLRESGWLIKTSSGKIARGQNREKWLTEKATKSP